MVGVLLICWMLLMPQGSQPDEHSHLVRSAALIRGSDGDGVHTVPDRYRVAEPACYAFDPNQPVTCSAVPVHAGGDTTLITRADDYPPGAHALFGIVSLLPGLDPVWWARLTATFTSAALVGSALAFAVRKRRLLGAALLLGLTPMAWSIMTAVNPSAFATAGAAALWIGTLRSADDDGDRAGWLLTAGWVALVLPRRDGLVWACLIVALVALSSGMSLLAWARRLGRARVATIGGAAAVTMAWGITSSSNTSRLVVIAPLALVAAELGGSWWRRGPREPIERRALVVGALGIGMTAWVVVLALRPGGWNTDLLLAVLGQTDDNLVEAVGVLGWLDTPVPWLVVFGWIALVGMLATPAVLARRWQSAAMLAGLTAVTSWTFEMIQGNDSGTYWQGRYSLPLLIGVPLLLADRAPRDAERLALPVAVGALAFVNVGAWSAARRFGVGHQGSYLPWRWDTPLQPIPPVLLLLVMAAASIALLDVVVGARGRRR